MITMKEEFYDIKEICEILKVTRLSVYRWIKAKKLPAYKVGKTFLIKKEDFKEFLNKRKV